MNHIEQHNNNQTSSDSDIRRPTYFDVICAMAQNRVIGKANKLPWHLPKDLQYFKQQTLGKPMIMGRLTFESFKRPLPKRDHIILSKTPRVFSFDRCYHTSSFDQALALSTQLNLNSGRPMVIGGAKLYAQALHHTHCHTLWLTVLHANFDGDTYFPESLDSLQTKGWKIISQTTEPADDQHYCRYTFFQIQSPHHDTSD